MLLLFLSHLVLGQSADTAFFPKFIPYEQNPILNYGDELFGSPWNDPTVLKEGNQYIMYTSGVEGGLNHPTDSIGIYRWLSADGYSWSLDPVDPVLEPNPDAYYSGGIETPSVVYYADQYHMYNSVYIENDPFQFKISHATSSDGISWEMDTNIGLEPTDNLDWMSLIVAEPGVMVKQDTLYLFFYAAGPDGNQSIGLVRTTDGTNFIDTTLTATLPAEVYPDDQNYVGLSTPSPILIGDTIYLFTDVSQTVFGDNWMQVALHQFKSYGDLNHWYHDTVPIHTRHDFSWSDGNYMAEIRSITPLLDGNKLRIWYAGHNIAEIDTELDDTLFHVHFIGDELHVDQGYWAFGTSEYIFDNITGIAENHASENDINIDYFKNSGFIKSDNSELNRLKVFSISGQLLFEENFYNDIDFSIDYTGIIVINVISKTGATTEKHFAF